MNEHRLKKEENFKRKLSEAKVDMWPNIREEDGWSLAFQPLNICTHRGWPAKRKKNKIE